MSPQNQFTAEDKAAIGEMMRAGLSASQIGAKMGRSRNSICGLVHRNKELGGIGLNGERWRGGNRPRSAERTVGEQPKPRPVSIAATRKISNGKVSNAHPGNIRSKAESRARDPGLVEEPTVAPTAHMVALVDLKANDCRFPIGDPKKPDFGFCGAPRRPGHSYCTHHRKIACAGVWRPA